MTQTDDRLTKMEPQSSGQPTSPTTQISINC